MIESLISAFLLIIHPFYVSITSVDYNEEAKRVEVSSRIFYDDLEVALKGGTDRKIDLIKPADRAEVDSLLAGYFRRYFRLGVDGKAVSLHYLGYEVEDDVAWCYLEATDIANVGIISLDCRLLYEQFPGQSHIIHATARGKRQSTKLDNPERYATFRW